MVEEELSRNGSVESKGKINWIELRITTDCRMAFPRDFSSTAVRRGWIRELCGPLDEARWNELARELFTWQFAQVPAFRRLCLGREVSPKTLGSWRDIPAMPQQLFKREKLFGHGTSAPAAVYETSGTTTGEPGRQFLLSTDIYKAMSVEGAWREGLFKDGADFYFLTASPVEARHSSLSAMFGFWRKVSGQEEAKFWMRDGAFDFAGFRRALTESVKKKRPVAICGTAFSFVHFLDAGGEAMKLPRGSWLLETGGFKGRTREVPKAELYAEMARIFGVKDDAIWNEYGMSELSSQAYARGTHGLHATPPWARVLVCDPANGREVRVGQEGLVRWIDLANVDSVMALQTLDRAERRPKGFRLIGRLPRTEPRGCSLSAEDITNGRAGPSR
jgi:phenylacetate-coenzyme A ligase PaaK-like adenylate-forming protein